MNTSLNPRQRNDSRSRRRGIMLILFALLLAPMLALIGLAIDGGHIYFEKRRMQAAADGGAVGAAREILRGNDGLVVSGGREDTKLNGFDNALSDINVIVNRPPSTGPNSGDNNAVEVIIERPVATTFMKILQQQDTLVRARAVAGIQPELKAPCILALNPSTEGAIKISGNVDINIPDCIMVAASDDPEALEIMGNVNVVTGGMGFGAPVGSGGWVKSGNGYVDPWPPYSMPGVTDPYEYMKYLEPDPGLYPMRSAETLKLKTDTILDPGYYQGGIEVSNGIILLRAGLYIVDGLKVNGGFFGNLDPITPAGGVTIFNTAVGKGDTIEISGNSTIDLHASYYGDYANILFFNSYTATPKSGSSGTDAKLLGDANSVYDGVMYFPTVELEYGGSATQGGTFAMIIADTLSFHGTPQLGADWEGAGRTPTIQHVSLLE